MSHPANAINLFQYAFLALPLSFAGLPLYIHMPDFYTRDLGLHIGLLGVILLGIRLFDALQDPVIGYISDRYPQKRLNIVMLGLGALILGLGGLFYGPQFSASPALWFAGFMILATTGFSLISINMNMIGGFWRDTSGERARISSAREGFGLLGLLLAALIPILLQQHFRPENAFIALFWIFACISALAGYIFLRFMRCFSSPNTKASPAYTFSFIQILFGPDRIFFTTCFLAQFAASIPAVLVMFFIRDYLDAGEYAGLFLIIYFLSGAALIRLWIKLSDYYGLYNSWLISMVVSVATFAWAYLLQPGDLLAYGIICTLSGMALGADLALPPAILAGRINAQKTEVKATQYYAVQSFLPKLSMAVAAGISLTFLGLIGFEAGGVNSRKALHGLIATYALLPCFIKMLSGACLFYLMQREGDYNEKVKRSVTHGFTRNS